MSPRLTFIAQVTNERKWTLVGKTMGYNVNLSPTVCTQLKTAYLKIVVPFEDYVKRVNLAGGVPPPDPTILNDDVAPRDELAAKLNATPGVSNGAEVMATLATPASDAAGPVNGGNPGVRTASDKLNEAIEMENKGKGKWPSGRGWGTELTFSPRQTRSRSLLASLHRPRSRSRPTTILQAR